MPSSARCTTTCAVAVDVVPPHGSGWPTSRSAPARPTMSELELELPGGAGRRGPAAGGPAAPGRAAERPDGVPRPRVSRPSARHRDRPLGMARNGVRRRAGQGPRPRARAARLGTDALHGSSDRTSAPSLRRDGPRQCSTSAQHTPVRPPRERSAAVSRQLLTQMTTGWSSESTVGDRDVRVGAAQTDPREFQEALVAAGLPPAVQQHPVVLPNGRTAYLDLAYPDCRARHRDRPLRVARDTVGGRAGQGTRPRPRGPGLGAPAVHRAGDRATPAGLRRDGPSPSVDRPPSAARLPAGRVSAGARFLQLFGESGHDI